MFIYDVQLILSSTFQWLSIVATSTEPWNQRDIKHCYLLHVTYIVTFTMQLWKHVTLKQFYRRQNNAVYSDSRLSWLEYAVWQLRRINDTNICRISESFNNLD
jgi:hypothetical protein